MKRLAGALMVVLFLTMVGCSSSTDDNNTDQAFKDTSTIETTGTFNIISIHKSGTLLGIDSDAGSDYAGRIVWKLTPDSPEVTVWADANGNPTLANMSGIFIVFENWTDTTVDVAAIVSPGDVRVLKGVSLSSSIQESRAKLSSASTTAATPSLATLLRWGAHAVSAAVCVASLVAEPLTLGLDTALTLLSCGNAALGIYLELTDADNTAVKASSTVFGTFMSAAGCINSNVNSCYSFFANLIASVATYAEGQKTADSGIIDMTRQDLQSQQVFLDSFDNGLASGWGFRVSSGLTQAAAHSGTYSIRVYDSVGSVDESECYKMFTAVSKGIADFWMYMPSNSPAPVLVYLSDQSVWQKHPNPRFWVVFNLNGTVQWNHASVWQDFPSAATFNFNVWNHIQFLWDSVQNKMRFVINGKDHGTVSEMYTGGYITQLVFMKGSWDLKGLFAYFDDVSVSRIN
jgi:hypothetical protein